MQEKHIFVFVSSCEFVAVKDGGLTWGKTTSRNWTTQRFGGEKRDPGMYYRVVSEGPSLIFSAIGGLLFAKKPSLPAQNYGEIETCV